MKTKTPKEIEEEYESEEDIHAEGFNKGFKKSQEMIREEIEKLFEKEIRDKKYGISEVLAITFYKNKLLSKIGGKE